VTQPDGGQAGPRASERDQPGTAQLRILLVEDDPDDVVLFRALLGKAAAGASFDHIDDPDRALARLKDQSYDLCFLDYRLGGDDGIEVLRGLRAQGYEGPAIMLTGQGDEAIAVEAMKAGASDYLIKRGLTPDSLRAAIRHALAMREQELRRQAVERALRGSEARYRDLVDRLPVIVCELTAEGETLFVNYAIQAITGWRPEDLIGRNWWETLAPGNREGQTERLRAALAAGDVTEFELSMKGRAGQDLIIAWNSANHYRGDGSLANVVCIGIDVTERARLREELRLLAVRDELTGLHNRRGFMTLADQQLKLAQRLKQPMILVFVDLDQLKSINDRLGHGQGDAALKDMAAVLRHTFRQSDVLGRLGGDEFVALVSEGSPFRGEGIVKRLNDNLSAFNASGDRPYRLGASIGVARYDPQAPMPIEELLNRADTQMYHDKRLRRRSSVLREPQAGG